METATLTRIEQLEECTRGVLVFGDHVLFTLEPPWLNNQVNISCIPGGDYLCEIDYSPKYGQVYHVRNVVRRSHILFHSGNSPSNTQGCILLGTCLGTLRNSPAVLSSRQAMSELYSFISKEPFTLRVTDVPIRNLMESTIS